MKKIRIQRSVDIPLLTDCHPVLARIYAARGVRAKAELDYRLTQLHHFNLLKNSQVAAQLLANAMSKDKRIIVIGDFDSDGATSTALAVSALRCLGATHVDYLVPNRFEYGYGLTPEIVQLAIKTKTPDLIITVDNGISSHEGVNEAKKAGLEVIITDHHLPGDALPQADVIVNPQQAGDTFPSKNLAGVGVIFYVMLAVRHELRQQQWFNVHRVEPNLSQFLDLVALGTIADLVPLDHLNRLFVHQGLTWIKAGKARPAIYALLKLAQREMTKLTASDLGFAIAPRLNAAGRLADMSVGVACLLANDKEKAYQLALKLSQLNEERRTVEATMRREAFILLDKQIAKKPSEYGICLFHKAWHQGIIGLLAARITERLYRPSVVFAPGQEEEIKGSARSIPGVHIRDVLAAIAQREPGLISKFGGHAMAAGLSLPQAHFFHFSQLLQMELAKLNASVFQGRFYTDGELTADQSCLELAELVNASGPWGQGFPEPIFEGRFELLSQRLVGNKHLKMILKAIDFSSQYEAIAFNVDMNVWPNHRAQQVIACYRLSVNDYRGRKTLQLIVENLEVE